MRIARNPYLAVSLAGLGLGCIAVRQLWMFRTGLELRLPGELSMLAFTAGVFVVLAPYIICLCSVILAVLAALKKSPAAILHCVTGALVVLAIWAAGKQSTYRYDAGIMQTLRTHDEKAYVELAARIRDRTPPTFDTFGVDHDVSSQQVDYKTLQQKKLDQLNALMPDELPVARMWPKEMLNITIDPNMVRIQRGSGMLGQIGVVVLKEGGEVETFSEEQLAENFYLPRYTRIYDRVYYFYSD